MGFEENYGLFQVKNNELAALGMFAYRASVNTMMEQSAALSIGMSPHAIARQKQYIEAFQYRLDGVNAMPWPDVPATHPTLYDCDATIIPPTILSGVTPLNEDTFRCATQWSIIMKELMKANSASLGGGLIGFDYNRAVNNLKALAQIVESIEGTPDVDFAETAEPGAVPGKPGKAK